MKKINKPLIIAALGIIAVSIIGCWGANPKALAKQYFDLSNQYEETDDNDKEVQLLKKMDQIEAKVEKLSDKDQGIYYDELDRLESLASRSDAGFYNLDDVYNTINDAPGSLQNEDAFDDVKEALDAANSAAKSVKSLGF